MSIGVTMLHMFSPNMESAHDMGITSANKHRNYAA